MIKVLVANSNKAKTLNCCEYLSNDKELKVFGTNTGMATLNTYLEMKPDIFVLNMRFDDINGIEIIDKLSLSAVAVVTVVAMVVAETDINPQTIFIR